MLYDEFIDDYSELYFTSFEMLMGDHSNKKLIYSNLSNNPNITWKTVKNNPNRDFTKKRN